MVRRFVGYSTLGIVLASSIGTHGQQQPRPTTSAARATAIDVEGCLIREQDLPGRKPNVAERVGILASYVVADAKIAERAGSPERPPVAESPVGTSGEQRMYRIAGMDGERLKTFVGKRVRIEGDLADVDPSRPGSRIPPEEIPELRGSAIREVPGTCAPPVQ